MKVVVPTILVGVLSWVNSIAESHYQSERFRVICLRDFAALLSSNLAFPYQICCGSALSGARFVSSTSFIQGTSQDRLFSRPLSFTLEPLPGIVDYRIVTG